MIQVYIIYLQTCIITYKVKYRRIIETIFINVKLFRFHQTILKLPVNSSETKV